MRKRKKYACAVCMSWRTRPLSVDTGVSGGQFLELEWRLDNCLWASGHPRSLVSAPRLWTVGLFISYNCVSQLLKVSFSVPVHPADSLCLGTVYGHSKWVLRAPALLSAGLLVPTGTHRLPGRTLRVFWSKWPAVVSTQLSPSLRPFPAEHGVWLVLRSLELQIPDLTPPPPPLSQFPTTCSPICTMWLAGGTCILLSFCNQEAICATSQLLLGPDSHCGSGVGGAPFCVALLFTDAVSVGRTVSVSQCSSLRRRASSFQNGLLQVLRALRLLF